MMWKFVTIDIFKVFNSPSTTDAFTARWMDVDVDLVGLRNSPDMIAQINGPIEATHRFVVPWPHSSAGSDEDSGSFQAHLRVKTGEPITGEDFIIESIGARMIWVEPGTFTMGSPVTEGGLVETQHEVR